ncbi:DUF6705 family protein [Nonlabens ponticola]|uniref:DUF6705 domain-containing protein n=1 Tax=Nonlabens ponticola TaxID=2496866 RepID=A0A3S9MVB5_9FLAO|nr:DUF6705 family protein [Nonlabens ponticola]AZQ43080.1 hypothetical protein EJ995_02085 [Nonlabens ponticola]
MKLHVNLIFFIGACLGYSQIVPIDYNYLSIDDQSNLYIKDINNDMLVFEGTYKFEQSNEEFTLVLERVEAHEKGGEYGKADMLLGNYKYVKNGVEIINTLNQAITQGSPDDVYHFSSMYFRPGKPVNFIFEDPVNSKWTSYDSNVILSTREILTSSGLVEQKVLRMKTMIVGFLNLNDDPEASQRLRIPKEMTLIKVD